MYARSDKVSTLNLFLISNYGSNYGEMGAQWDVCVCVFNFGEYNSQVDYSIRGAGDNYFSAMSGRRRVGMLRRKLYATCERIICKCFCSTGAEIVSYEGVLQRHRIHLILNCVCVENF